MTRKDYEATARMFRVELITIDAAFKDPEDAVKKASRRAAVIRCVCGMADVFGADNPRFDRPRFLAACGCPLEIDQWEKAHT